MTSIGAPSVSFVVDTDPACGRGHLSRCLLLASAMREQGAKCHFYTTHPVSMPGLERFPVTALSEMHTDLPGIVVVDGYRFDFSFLHQLKRKADRFVLIDDLGDRPFPADLVLNHNIYADQLNYSAYAGAELLLGPRYALVRSEYFDLADYSLAESDVRVLISFGSGPLALYGLELANALHEETGVKIDVVLGGAGKPDPILRGEGIETYVWADLAELGKAANLVICGLGVTFLEFMAAKKNVIGVKVAENQSLALTKALEIGYQAFDCLDIKNIVRCASQLLNGKQMLNSQAVAINPLGPSTAASAILKES